MHGYYLLYDGLGQYILIQLILPNGNYINIVDKILTFQFIKIQFYQLYKDFQFSFMGNNACCTAERLQQMNAGNEKGQPNKQPQPKQVNAEPTQNKPNQQPKQEQPVPREEEVQREISPQIPELLPKVAETLAKNNFFEKYLVNGSEQKTISYGDHIYKGQVRKEQLKPQGLGTLYKSDKSLIIGNFKEGKLNGKGVYIFANGSFFQGLFINNQAICQDGYYESEYLKYRGGFKDSKFHGRGVQFQGEYVNGLKDNGIFKWSDQNKHSYQYEGTFNQRQEFHGQGVLKQKRGVYEGGFVNGHKQGKGVYKGKNGIKYEGEYKKGKKQGYGMIYNKDGIVTYKGDFKDGLPHGKGAAFVKNKQNSQFIQAEFVQGVDKSILERLEQQVEVPIQGTINK